MPKVVAAARAEGGGLEVVFQHQLLREARRGLRLVDVRALGEGEELRDPLEDPKVAVLCRFAMTLSVGLGQARWTGIDPEPFAELAKSGAVGRLGRALEHLVHVLVRHFVLQHLEHRAPRMGQDERARHLDRAACWIPLSEARRAVCEAYRRGPQAPLEVARG